MGSNFGVFARVPRIPPPLATAAALAIVTAGPAFAGKSETRLGTDVVPTFQSIHLDVDPGRDGFSGSVRIELDVRAPADRFRLHSEGLEIREAALRAGDRAVEITHGREADDVLVIRCSHALDPQPHVLTIDFTGLYSNKSVGLYTAKSGDQRFLFTQFEADDAREAFPCWDEPSFKIPFQLTLTFPDGQTALSNTPVERESVDGASRTVVFEKTKPLPAYLLALAVGPLETVEIPGMSVPGRVVAPRGQEHLAGVAVEMTPPILAALEKWFDRRYPYRKLDLIAVPEFWPGAMENAGAVTYRDGILLLDPAHASVAQRRSQARVTAHELAHQWFGDLVTMEWWDDLWLNESFADWMGDKIVQEVFPEFRHRVSRLQSAQRILASDARPSTKPIRRPFGPADPLFEGVGLAYAKGRMVLDMFEGWMGEETLRRGVLDYIEENAWGNARAADLWTALDASSGHDVSSAIAGFLEQPGYPLIRAEVVGGGRVRLSQSRFHNQGVEVEDLTWDVPVVLHWSDGEGAHRRSVLLDERSKELDLESAGPIRWILPNGGASAYYRWWVAPEWLAALVAASAKELDPIERVEFLGNLTALLDAGEVDGATFVHVVGEMRDDPDPLVVSAVASAVGKVHSAFVTPGLEDEFAVWVRGTLGPALERIGRVRGEGEAEAVSFVRPDLIATLADWGRDEELRAWARGRSEDWLADPESVDPSLIATVLQTGALAGDAELHAKYLARFESAESPTTRSRMISALASFRDHGIREEVLEWALGALRPNEFFNLYFAFSGNEEGRDRYFRYLRENYETFVERNPADRIAGWPRLGGGCSPERLELARKFFTDPDRIVPGTESTLRRVTDQVTDCVNLRAREGDSVARFLRGYARAPATSGPPSAGSRPSGRGSSGAPPPGGAPSPRR